MAKIRHILTFVGELNHILCAKVSDIDEMHHLVQYFTEFAKSLRPSQKALYRTYIKIYCIDRLGLSLKLAI